MLCTLLFPLFTMVFAGATFGMELMLTTDHTCMGYSHPVDMDVGEFARASHATSNEGMSAWLHMHAYVFVWAVGAIVSVAIMYMQMQTVSLTSSPLRRSIERAMRMPPETRTHAIVHATLVTKWAFIQAVVATSASTKNAMWWRCTRWRFAVSVLILVTSCVLGVRAMNSSVVDERRSKAK